MFVLSPFLPLLEYMGITFPSLTLWKIQCEKCQNVCGGDLNVICAFNWGNNCKVVTITLPGATLIKQLNCWDCIPLKLYFETTCFLFLHHFAHTASLE